MANDNDSLCNCWIRHAVTPTHRKEIFSDLEYYRKVGDSTGILMAMAQLSPCPAVQSSASK